jgi:chromosomal replication initiator protein
VVTEVDLESVWGQVLSYMEAELQRTSFETWLRRTQAVGLSGDTFDVAVPDAFAREWIEGRYRPLIENTLGKVLGRPVKVRFSVPAWKSEVAATVDGSPPMTLFDERPVSGSAPGVRSSPEIPFSAIQPVRHSPDTYLNPKYTFERFVVGNSNRFAHAAALAVAESPARSYNPLFLYGGVGLGKTHLMQAIGHHVSRRLPGMAVMYVTAETFTNEVINAIRDDRTMEFKNRYRNNDVLLIDDIQFIAGKERTQEEFFHTFEALHGSGRQIVISSDRPPKDIPTLEERLRSRCEWGLLADIQAPDLETRVAILRKKALQESLPVPDDVIMHIATHVQTNIRELEGALIRIVASASLDGCPISLPMATAALRDILPKRADRPVTLGDIQRAVSRHFSLTVDDLKGHSRARKVALPRQLAMYLCRELTGASLPRIGEEFGSRDHTTVLHACEKITRERKESAEIEQTLARLEHDLHEVVL